jgi:TetR/AcrR family transcriptional repressor of nem operon
MAKDTKQQLIERGVQMLLTHGYHDLGIAALLAEVDVPKGSFYHHFEGKEDFALQAVDFYMAGVQQALDATLGDHGVPPLARVRNFFAGVEQSYRGEGYLGCLLGGLGQELSGVSETFRRKVDACIDAIARRLGDCLVEAGAKGQLQPGADPRALAQLLVNCWEGAALRSRLQRDPTPLGAMLDFYFGAVGAAQKS